MTYSKRINRRQFNLITIGESNIENDDALLSPPPSPSPSPSIDANTTALLVVDVQPEYWTDCLDVRKDFPSFPTNLERTINICRKKNVKIIHIRADYKYSQSPWLPHFQKLRGDKNLAEVHYNPSSPDFVGWEEFATPEEGEIVISKPSWSATNNTKLLETLKNKRIETVLVAGLITSVCVQQSAFGCFEAGFRTILVEDACADRGKARHDAALALYGDYMYEVSSSYDLESQVNSIMDSKETNMYPSKRHTCTERMNPELYKMIMSSSCHLEEFEQETKNIVAGIAA
ncbi:MAG: nicotinamidase-related amidase [Bacillariaceae sp.]|jgi:nicotinamidase-related amidase